MNRMMLKEWLALSLPAEQAAHAAEVLGAEDFEPSDLVNPRTTPDQADLADLFPDQGESWPPH